jgi:hypothetical protein
MGPSRAVAVGYGIPSFDVTTPSWPISIRIINAGGAANILVENCSVQHSMVLIDSVDGALLNNCQFSDGLLGVQLYGNANVSVDNCVFDGMSAGGIELEAFSSAVCQVRDSVVGGGNVALAAMGTNSHFEVTNSRLVGGTAAVFLAASGASSVISDCDLVKGSGPVARCRDGGPIVVHDLRNNYWGTTDEVTIQSWIVDHADNPQIGATVLYSPLRWPVCTNRVHLLGRPEGPIPLSPVRYLSPHSRCAPRPGSQSSSSGKSPRERLTATSILIGIGIALVVCEAGSYGGRAYWQVPHNSYR